MAGRKSKRPPTMSYEIFGCYQAYWCWPYGRRNCFCERQYCDVTSDVARGHFHRLDAHSHGCGHASFRKGDPKFVENLAGFTIRDHVAASDNVAGVDYYTASDGTT